jgi:hypothetical protein
MAAHMLAEERFWSKVERTDGCWKWLGQIAGNGYAAFSMHNRLRSAHRVAWEFTNGPIPDGMWVLHHCDNPLCVRPDHLFLGTVVDNNRDTVAKRRNPAVLARQMQTQCIHGHPFDEDNVYLAARGSRHCRTCNRMAQARRYARRMKLVRA